MLKMSDLNLKNKRVLIREDLNVPLEKGQVANDQRILAALPTIKQALAAGAAVIIMSHLGRPEEGQFDVQYSLEPVATDLAAKLQRPVKLINNDVNSITIKPGEIALYENVRFNRGEKKNDTLLAKKLASFCDIFVMDAFATAHRQQASTYGVAEYAPVACAGPLLIKEIESLKRAFQHTKHPMTAVVGGSKVSTKLYVLKNLLTKIDHLIVGGGIANTFIAASGYNIGRSLYEKSFLNEARELLDIAKQQNKNIPIPTDVKVAKEFAAQADAVIKSINNIADDEMILDIGPVTAAAFAKIIHQSATIIWNGPVGVFEFDHFAEGTKTIAKAIANSSAFSLAGGGDTIAAIDKYHLADKISYISTGGGAFLEYLEGKTLPAVAILEEREKSAA